MLKQVQLMFTVLVDLQVRPERLEEFLEGIRINSRASLRDEPGCLRFDVHQHADDPHRFVLYEIYADQAAFYEAPPHRAALRRLARGLGPLRRPGRPREHLRHPGVPGRHPGESDDQSPSNARRPSP